MAGRRSFKSDESFLEKLAIGAMPSRCRKSATRKLKSSPHEMAGSNAVQPDSRAEECATSASKVWQAISRGKIRRSVAPHPARFPDYACRVIADEGYIGRVLSLSSSTGERAGVRCRKYYFNGGQVEIAADLVHELEDESRNGGCVNDLIAPAA